MRFSISRVMYKAENRIVNVQALMMPCVRSFAKRFDNFFVFLTFLETHSTQPIEEPWENYSETNWASIA